MRAEALRLAAASAERELVALLPAGLTDRSASVRGSSLQALLELENRQAEAQVIEQLTRGPRQGRAAMMELALRAGSETLRAEVLNRAARDSSSVLQRVALRRALLDPDRTQLSAELLNRAIGSSDERVAARAIELLTERGESGALHSVHLNLLSETLEERIAALRILALTPSVNAWPYLRWIQQNGEDEETSWAALALARMDDLSVVDEVEALLNSDDLDFLVSSIRVLPQIGGEEAIDILRTQRHDSREGVRAAALEGLMTLSAPLDDIIPFLEDPDREISRTASMYLLRSEGVELARHLCPDLRLNSSPLPTLRFLWLARTEAENRALIESCVPQLEALTSSEVADEVGISARLLYWVRSPDPAAYTTDLSQQPELLYAYLEASLQRDAERYRDIYRELLGHDLLAVRMTAAVGLLKTTP
jgi:HEAT repeat protein